MSLFGFPDWKKIGWRAGKRLRDILNPPSNNGPSKEERLAQRLRDSLKGLVYFDVFHEVKEWSLEDVDPVQQANTPLLERSASKRSAVLLKHVANCFKLNRTSGGYHDYESVRPPLLNEKAFSCTHLQYVDTFIYFSHKLVCVPPAAWINTLHRNGVKVLGTFLIEGQTSETALMFDRAGSEYIIAKRLASMARAFGFDGWLLNIEGEIPKIVADPVEKLTAFILDLKHCLGPQGEVIWYDALTIDNEVDYQNGLTPKNMEFALAADALFTNYRWIEIQLKNSRENAERFGIKYTAVHFGIDVWAQNTNMPGPARVTYPENGGGGTLTGLALNTLADYGFSAAIFAPAWTHQHFSSSTVFGKSNAEEVEQSMWAGVELPDNVGCDCSKGKPHHRDGYQMNPITKAGREFPAGSSSFFETDFSGPFMQIRDPASQGEKQIRSMLGAQAILPNLSLSFTEKKWQQSSQQPLQAVLSGQLVDEPFNHLRVSLQSTGHKLQNATTDEELKCLQVNQTARLRLFKLNMPVDGTLEATFDFKRDRSSRIASAGFYFTLNSPESETAKYRDIQTSFKKQDSFQTLTIDLDSRIANSWLCEVGVFCEGNFNSTDSRPLFYICNLVVKPKNEIVLSWKIINIRAIQRQAGSNVEKRLAWNWSGLRDLWPAGLPWSNTTGPFSKFVVYVDGKELDHSFCVEFPVRPDDQIRQRTSNDSNDVAIVVKGTLFGGRTVFSPPTRIRKEDLVY